MLDVVQPLPPLLGDLGRVQQRDDQRGLVLRRDLGFGRSVVSDTEAPNTLANPV